MRPSRGRVRPRGHAQTWLDREARAPSGAPTLDHLAATLGRHARAEAVLPLSRDAFGLPGPLRQDELRPGVRRSCAGFQGVYGLVAQGDTEGAVGRPGRHRGRCWSPRATPWALRSRIARLRRSRVVSWREGGSGRSAAAPGAGRCRVAACESDAVRLRMRHAVSLSCQMRCHGSAGRGGVGILLRLAADLAEPFFGGSSKTGGSIALTARSSWRSEA